jgi:spore germination protein GerM
MKPLGRNVVTVLALLALLAVVSMTAPRWARVLRQPAPVLDEGPPEEAQPITPPSPEAQGEVQRTINVKLLFESPEQVGLVSEERPVPYHPELARQLRAVVEALVEGPKTGLAPTLPPETKVLEVFVTARGVAYVDLSKEAAGAHPGGSVGELLTVYSIVNSLTANFPVVKRVQILVDDRPVPTFAGHVDLSRPLAPDMTLLAAAQSPAPAPSPHAGGETPPPSPPSPPGAL